MKSTSFHTRLLATALGLWIVLGMSAPTAHAQAPRPAQVTASDAARGKVRIDALVVHATNQGASVDPRLRGLQRKLTHLRYSSYKVLSSHTDTIAPGQTATVAVVGGRRLKVAFLERTPKHARVRIQVFKGNDKKLDTQVQLPRDQAFVVAGPKHEGGVLLFPITVSY